MALVKPTLEAQLLAAFSAAQASESETAQSDLCADLATAIDAYIKSATVTVVTGIPVATAGSPTAQTGATTGPGTGTLS